MGMTKYSVKPWDTEIDLDDIPDLDFIEVKIEL